MKLPGFEKRLKLVEKALLDLGKHFDAVEILASTNRSDGAGWECIKRGRGSYIARIGMAKELLDEDNPRPSWRTMTAELLDRGWVETCSTPERGCAYLRRWRSPEGLYIESTREAWAAMRAQSSREVTS